jgi:Protein of unknwon function (DUF3310)
MSCAKCGGPVLGGAHVADHYPNCPEMFRSPPPYCTTTSGGVELCGKCAGRGLAEHHPDCQFYEDLVNHPKHYTAHPSGIECITVVEHMSFNIGNAIKYLWRQGLKQDPGGSEPKRIEDLKKAAWYVNREIERLSK